MLEDGNSLLADAAARILAHAGRLMRVKAAIDRKAMESAERKLFKLSKDGSPKAAKASVRCGLPVLLICSFCCNCYVAALFLSNGRLSGSNSFSDLKCLGALFGVWGLMACDVGTLSHFVHLCAGHWWHYCQRAHILRCWKSSART